MRYYSVIINFPHVSRGHRWLVLVLGHWSLKMRTLCCRGIRKCVALLACCGVVYCGVMP